MKATILVTGVEQTQYLALQFATLEGVMSEAEKNQAQVKGWNVKGVEPGGDEVFTFRIAADSVDPDLPQKIFQAAEVDCRGVTGRGWVRTGQTSGSVDATVTFQAVGIRFVDMSVILEEQKNRQQQAEYDKQRRKAQRDAFEALTKAIQARLSGGGQAEANPAVSNGKVSK